MINIFTGLSQNQINSFEKLILSNRVIGGKILISNSFLSFDNKLWDEVILSNLSFNNNSENTFSSIKNIIIKILEYKKIIKKIKKYKTEKEISIYFTYIEDVITNYLALSFNKNIIGYVIEDGTLNYYNHTIKSLSKKKYLLKWIISNLLGIRFKTYNGHSSGIEYSHVKKQYVRLPELSMFPEKSELLEYNNYKIDITNTILIIGQEAYINTDGIDRYHYSLEKLISIINENHNLDKIKNVYYKPHRHGQRINYSELESKFKKGQLIVLDSNTPLEDIYFNELKSFEIYGFDSSALVNIYLELDNEIKSKINFNVLLSYNDKLENLFKKFNFKIFK